MAYDRKSAYIVTLPLEERAELERRQRATTIKAGLAIGISFNY